MLESLVWNQIKTPTRLLVYFLLLSLPMKNSKRNYDKRIGKDNDPVRECECESAANVVVVQATAGGGGTIDGATTTLTQQQQQQQSQCVQPVSLSSSPTSDASPSSSSS
jgi:hypothetical protein